MRETVQSVVRGLTILEIVAKHGEIGLSEISTLSTLNKATVHRLLSTLIATGYIEQVDKNGLYRQTYKLFLLGNKKVENINSYKIARRFLSELSNTIEATVHLVVEDNREVVYVDKIDPTESHSGFRLQSRVGKRAPMYCTAVGKILISQYPDEIIKEIWKTTEITSLTSKTITDLDTFMKEIALIRSQGFALDNEENEVGVVCVASTFLNHKGVVEGAISSSIPTMFFKDKSQHYIENVTKCADKISQALGYMPSK